MKKGKKNKPHGPGISMGPLFVLNGRFALALRKTITIHPKTTLPGREKAIAIEYALEILEFISTIVKEKNGEKRNPFEH